MSRNPTGISRLTSVATQISFDAEDDATNGTYLLASLCREMTDKEAQGRSILTSVLFVSSSTFSDASFFKMENSRQIKEAAIAHINHVEADRRPENLVALCPACHFEYDGYRRAMQRLAKKRIESEVALELFNGHN